MDTVEHVVAASPGRSDAHGHDAYRKRCEALFAQTAVGICRTSLEGRFLDVNQKLCEILGYPRDELLNRTFLDVTHPADRQSSREFRRQLLNAMPGAESGARDKRYIRKDGTVAWANVVVSTVRGEDGRPDYFVAIVQDISARKASEEGFRATFEQAAVGIVRADLQRNIIDANWKFCEMTGYGRDELLRMSIMQISHPGDLRQDAALRARLLAGKIDHFQSEKRYVRKDGGVIWVRRTTSLARDITNDTLHYIIVVEDVTGRKAAEESYRTTFDHAPIGIMHSAADRRILEVNAKLCEILGYTREELLSMTTADLLPPEHLATDRPRYFDGMLNGEIQAFSSERPFVRKDGSIVWTNRTVSLVRDAAGQPLYFLRIIEDITDRKRAEQARRESEQRFRAMFHHAGVGITMRPAHDRAHTWTEVNDQFCRMLGYTREELLCLSTRDITVPDDQERAIADNERLKRGDIRGYTREKRLIRKDGSHIWVMLAVAALPDETGQLKNIINVYQDITERKRVEAALHESDEKFRQLASNIPQVFWITDAEQKAAVYVSPAYEAITGLNIADLDADPRNWLAAVHETDRERVRRARKERAVLGAYDMEYRVVHTDGTVRWIHDRAFPVKNAAGEVWRIAGIGEDITERKRAQEKLLQLAHYDVLTSLPNRVLLYDRLKQALAQARRNEWTLAVLFIDLDRFKLVNDSLGHAVGDRLLQQVSERLANCVRVGDTVGRLGGDEFAVILSELAAPQDTRRVAQKILDALAQPFQVESTEIFVTASIGISIYPSDSDDVDTLIRNADAAMFSAKEQGRNKYQFFTAEMNARAQERMQLDNRLRRAAERGEFVLLYQPKVGVAHGRLTGLEALLRWHPPENGLVSPDEFIPVLEDTGLIVPVGEWVLRETCAQIRAWRMEGIAPVPVAVNLSARQLQQPGFDTMLGRLLDEYGVEPNLLELEITESSLMRNPDEASLVLSNLGRLGVSLSVDDFGTGYSSLAYLKRFPIDALKIDRSFVHDIAFSPDSAAITRSVITLAHSLDLKVVAEGVETREQLAYLCANRCDEAQGYLFSPPLPAAQCTELLRSRRPLHDGITACSAGRSPAVLVVDDEANSLLLAERLLRQDGHRVLTAADTRTAFDLLARDSVHAVVADQNMPDMAGVEFLRSVKQMHPGIVRIMLSGSADFDSAASSINEGEVHRYFVKGRDDELLRRELCAIHRNADARCMRFLDME